MTGRVTAKRWGGRRRALARFSGSGDPLRRFSPDVSRTMTVLSERMPDAVSRWCLGPRRVAARARELMGVSTCSSNGVQGHCAALRKRSPSSSRWGGSLDAPPPASTRYQAVCSTRIRSRPTSLATRLAPLPERRHGLERSGLRRSRWWTTPGRSRLQLHSAGHVGEHPYGYCPRDPGHRVVPRTTDRGRATSGTIHAAHRRASATLDPTPDRDARAHGWRRCGRDASRLVSHARAPTNRCAHASGKERQTHMCRQSPCHTRY